MPRTKEHPQNKIRSKHGAISPSTEIEEVPLSLVAKNKLLIEIEDPDEKTISTEKSDSDSPTEEDAEELGVEEISLDDEEVNPFGDKWEE